MRPWRKYIGMSVQGNWLVLIYCFIVLLIFCYLLSTAYFTCCLFLFFIFFNSHFPTLRGIFAFHYILLFLRLNVDPFIFAKYLFGVPYEINSSLLIATTKREHSFLNKVREEFNAPEKTYWNVCPVKLVMPTMLALIYCFIVV